MIRSTFAAAAVLAAVAAAPAAPVPAAPDVAPPTVTVQLMPGGPLLDQIKAFVKGTAGADAVKVVDKYLKETLGEKGFTGVDLLRPPAGYAYLAPKVEESWGVIVVPVTGEKEFLDLLDRLKFKAAEKKGAKGLYEFTQLGAVPKDGAEPPVKVLMRFHDRCAYIGVNARDDALEVKNLVPAGKLIDPAEQAVFVARLDLARLDPALKKQAKDAIDEWDKEVAGIGPGNPFGFVAVPARAAVQVLKRYAGPVADEGERATFRLLADPATAELTYELALRARPGTPLARDIAARQPTVSRFAGILPETGVAGGVAQLPLFTPELRDAAEKLVQELAESVTAEEGRKVVAEVEKAAVRTIKAGEVDVGAALTGPDKDGLYTAVAAVTLDDPSGVEKALRAAVKGLPKLLQGAVKFDAAKVGDLSAHAATVGSLLPPEAQKLFGESAVLHVAFGPKAVYAALGPNGLAELRRVVALKPAAAKALDLRAHPKRLQAVLKAATAEAADALGAALPDADRMISLGSVEVRGGAELVVRYGSTTGQLRGLFLSAP